MVVRRKADLELLFQEALRKSIGDQRYQLWFADGVRFSFEGNVLSVKVDTPFMVDWINNGYARLFEKIGAELFNTPIKATVALKDANERAFSERERSASVDSNEQSPDDQSASQSTASSDPAPNAEQTSVTTETPNVNASPYLDPVLESVPTYIPSESAPNAFSVNEQSNAQEPRKRRRGRPRKNTEQEIPTPQNAFNSFNGSTFEPNVEPSLNPFSTQNAPDPFAPAFGSYPGSAYANAARSEFAQNDFTPEEIGYANAPYANQPPSAPPKRKRGRPRKNPVPEENDATRYAPNALPGFPQPGQFIQARQYPQMQTQTYPQARQYSQIPSPNAQGNPNETSFFDVFDAQAKREAFVNSVQNEKRETPTLSDAERIAWAVGNFDERTQRPDDSETPQYRPKRGRPKGSTNRRPRQTNASESVNLAPNAYGYGADNRARFEQRQTEPRRRQTLFDDEEEEQVSRDERGVSYVTRPKEAPRVKADPDRSTHFASLSTFVRGFSNQLACSVAQVAIAEPGAMSPIFVFGPTSVGKTHLLEGICDVYSRMPNMKPPLYMTSEQFTSAFIQSLRGPGAGFRNRFRDISLFALDDIHFLEGKLSTQTEFLNVLDFLRARRVQMIFSANRPLAELTKLRGELTTRIESGIVCKIDNPERETLAKILRQMALERNIFLDDDVCRYVVSRFAVHARQLSGALNRLFAAHLATGAPINLALARDALADLASANFRNVKLEDVERVVQDVFGLDNNSLKSSSRTKKCADPRAVAMWLARKYTRSALSEIGNFFGGRKHSAVLAAQRKVDKWIQTNEEIDAGDSVYPVNDAIERVERALANPAKRAAINV